MRRKEIEPKAKTEVQELLNGYIVEPLKSDMKNAKEEIVEVKEQLGQIEPAIRGMRLSIVPEISKSVSDSRDELADEIKNEIYGIEQRISGEINQTGNLIKGLGDTVKNVSESTVTTLNRALSENAVKIEGNLREITVCSKQTDEQLKELEGTLKSVSNTAEVLQKEMAEGQKKLEEILLAENQETQNIPQLITDSTQKLEDTAGKISDIAKNQFSELGRTVSTECHLTIEKIDELNRESAASSEHLKTMLAEYIEGAKADIDKSEMEIKEDVEKRYKVLLGVSVSFGIVNFLGVIATILLHFM